jgi:hypothetical protein
MLSRSRNGKDVRRGANAFPIRLGARRGEADLSRSFTVCSRPLVARVCSFQAVRSLFGLGGLLFELGLKLRTGVSGSFRIKQSGAITTSIPSTRSQYAREIAGQRANSPASFGRST